MVMEPCAGIDGHKRREPGHTFLGDPDDCEQYILKGILRHA